ncbi:MAG: transglycosylase SLT domain-containing protein [Nitrospirae bacterium]|nr:transglycosylase SLT domain-containing protein [Nitrospirota bacterium]
MKIIYSLFLLTLMGLLFVPVNSLLYSQPPDSAFDDLDKAVKDSPLDDKLDVKQLRKKQEGMDKSFRENMAVQEAAWGVLSKEMEAQWNEMVKRVNAQREALKKRVERQWDEFHDSTNKQWVDYSNGMDSRSIVDFENGEVEFSTLIPVDQLPRNKKDRQKKAKELAEKKVVKQIKKVLSPDNEVKTEVLKDQIKDPEGKKVTKENVEKFVEKHVAPEIKVEEKPVVAKDGVPRVKVTVKVQMVPEHLKVRAEKYKEQVNNYAAKYNLDPALIYALIHTESYFNPLAKSYIPAFGLMQLVPKSGAMDAYYYLHKEKKILEPEYLYDPGNNVMLGATYYHILNSIYLAEVKEDSNKESLSIAAYNWGPGNIKTKIIGKHNVDNMTDDEVVAIINKTAPQETIDYVSRVKTRKGLYKSM